MLKRKLAALLAGAMVLTSLPMVSFAKTDNNVDRVPVVSDDFNFKEAFEDGKAVPELTIKADPHVLVGQKFRLKFENAKWDVDGEETGDGSYVAGGVTEYTYRKLTDTSVQIEVKGTTGSSSDQIRIPMLVEMDGTGDAKVTIDPVDSTVSSGTYVFAIGGEGDTIATIEDVEKITDGDEIKTIEIRETKVGVFGGANQKIELRLPNNFSWDYSGASLIATGGVSYTTAVGTNLFDVENDGKILKINAVVSSDGASRGSLLLTGLKVKASNKARLGDVDVKISGEDITTQTIKVAEYVDYGVTVKADGDAKEIFAGRYNVVSDAWDDEAHELQKLIIEEDVINSWLSERTTTIEFPSWVKILGYKISEDNIDTDLDSDAIESDDDIELVTTHEADENEISFTSDFVGSAGDKRKLEITFFVSVEGNKEGDITATVYGRSLEEEYEVVLGKALAPVTVDVEPVDLRIGVKTQELSDITITETKDGAIEGTGTIEVTLPSNFEWNEEPTVEVTEGDLDIDEDDVKVEGRVLTIEVESDSREASTIVISDVAIDLDRTIPEGEFEIEVGGTAIVENDNDDDKSDIDIKDGGFKTDYVTKAVFANVVTPNPEDLAKGKASGQKASFTVGSADYTVGEEVATADAAPYIKDGRTMIPVKYAAYALGVDPSNIKWDQATKTATILGDRVIQVKIGSKDLVVNGAVLTMDVAAEVVDGRTYLPISWVASALNVPYSWDDATKTVTFN